MIRHLLFSILLCATPVAADTVRTTSIRVIDGDTVDIGMDRFRLVGFDTPESYRPGCSYELALGRAATARLRELLASVQLVEVMVLPGRDRYGRGLARLFVAQEDVGSILVAEGLARPYHGGQRQSWC